MAGNRPWLYTLPIWLKGRLYLDHSKIITLVQKFKGFIYKRKYIVFQKFKCIDLGLSIVLWVS